MTPNSEQGKERNSEPDSKYYQYSFVSVIQAFPGVSQADFTVHLTTHVTTGVTMILTWVTTYVSTYVPTIRNYQSHYRCNYSGNYLSHSSGYYQCRQIRSSMRRSSRRRHSIRSNSIRQLRSSSRRSSSHRHSFSLGGSGSSGLGREVRVAV